MCSSVTVTSTDDIRSLLRSRNAVRPELRIPRFRKRLQVNRAALEESTPSIREQLGRNGAKIAEFTVTTQFDTYRGFRVYNLYEDTPEAPVSRVLKSPSNPI